MNANPRAPSSSSWVCASVSSSCFAPEGTQLECCIEEHSRRSVEAIEGESCSGRSNENTPVEGSSCSGTSSVLSHALLSFLMSSDRCKDKVLKSSGLRVR